MVWRPRRSVSYGLLFEVFILNTISGCAAQSHRTSKQALQFFFAAQLLFLCEDVEHLTVFGLFRIALSKRRGEKKEKGICFVKIAPYAKCFYHV